MSIIEQIERGEAKARFKSLSCGNFEIVALDDSDIAHQEFQEVAEQAIAEAQDDGRYVLSHEARRGRRGIDKVVIGPKP